LAASWFFIQPWMPEPSGQSAAVRRITPIGRGRFVQPVRTSLLISGEGVIPAGRHARYDAMIAVVMAVTQ
jgi:hypothetical protein